MRRSAAILVLLAVARPALGLTNPVVDWQNTTEQVVRDLNISNQISAKYYALVNIAQYQSLLANEAAGNSIDGTAVTAFAAHYILSFFFPYRQNVFDGVIAKQLANVSAADKAAARSLSQPFAIKLIQSRVNDSTQQWAAFRPAPEDGPAGAYQFAPNQTFALYPQLANATTFATPNASPAPSHQFGATFLNVTTLTVGPAETFFASRLTQYRPLTVGSPEYLDNYNFTYTQGAKNSQYRAPYNTNTSLFWADLDGTSTINGQFYAIAKSLLPANASLLTTAELFARLGAAQFDSNVIGWYLKYYYLFWRPISAIRRGGSSFPADDNWRPLLATPAHPEYPSTHTVSAGAAGQVLARFFGSDNITFSVGSEYAPVKFAPRTYTSFTEAALEVGLSRVYGGIHFPKSGPDGRAVGAAVADTVYDNFPAALNALFGTNFLASSTAQAVSGGR